MLGGFLESKVWWIPGASWQSYFLILGFWESVNSGETVNPEDTPLLTFPRFPRFHEPTVTSLFTKGKVIRRMKRLVQAVGFIL